MHIAEVVLEQTAYSFDKPYSYVVPEDLFPYAKPGCRVVVPFGKGNTMRQGMILTVLNGDDDLPYKSIIRIIDETPIIGEEMTELCKWMHEHCFCTYFDAVKAVLPTGISFTVSEVLMAGEESFSPPYEPLNEFFKNNETATRQQLLDTFSFLSDGKITALIKCGALVKSTSAVRKMKDSTVKTAELAIPFDELDGIKLTARQKEVAGVVAEIGSVSVKELLYFTGASQSVVETLEKKGVIKTFVKEVYRSPIDYSREPIVNDIVLTDEQQSAYNTISKLFSSKKGEAALLYGVTGSGKTSVFLKLVDKAIAEGKGAIIMVPEISLTPQTVSIFGNRYGKKVALFHSAMSLGQRMDEWKRVDRGEATVVIGTRSAIFAPVKNLGIIIMDEEQEHTYKSEKSPRFHARDLAKFRTAYNKAVLVLASATPSIESFTAAKIGKYSMCSLKNRYGNAVLPEVKTVDMRREIMAGNSSSLSTELKLSINEALEKGNQAIVLLNRRGHNTYVTCPSCGYIATCPNCSVSMTYHSANNRMICHYCSYSEKAEKKCPSCSAADLRFTGVGTQKVAEELSVIFPDARVLRLDADSTMARDSFSGYLKDFSDGKYDIMIGTQMVAKGLNFPNVTVVGVIGADSAANSSDYRSFERSFSLLTQVLGRAGRGEDKGVAVIQTTDPESNLIKLAAKQDYDSFYNEEIGMRKLLTYPPYCDIAQVLVQSSFKELARKTADDILKSIKEQTSGDFSDVKLRVLGPSPAVCPKINNKYRYRLIIKAKNSKKFRKLLKNATGIKTEKDTTVSVDINPETLL